MTFDDHSRHWLLTWRTYGTWLPGDERGFVGSVVEATGERVIRNAPGTPQEPPAAGLEQFARSAMRAGAVLLEPPHAADAFSQLRETATARGWELLAVAIPVNHVHLVVRVGGDPDGADILRDFKCYASRRLNRAWGTPPGGSWWSESGSRRILRAEPNVNTAIEYVRGQAGALVVWAVALPEGPTGINTG